MAKSLGVRSCCLDQNLPLFGLRALMGTLGEEGSELAAPSTLGAAISGAVLVRALIGTFGESGSEMGAPSTLGGAVMCFRLDLVAATKLQKSFGTGSVLLAHGLLAPLGVRALAELLGVSGSVWSSGCGAFAQARGDSLLSSLKHV